MKLFKKKAPREDAKQADDKLSAVMAKREARKAATGDTRVPATAAGGYASQETTGADAVATPAPRVPAPSAAQKASPAGTGTLQGCPLDESDYRLVGFCTVAILC